MRHVGVAVATAVLLASCDTSTPVVRGEPVAHPYAGPMSLKRDFSDDASVLDRSGAAGRALQCDIAPYAGGGGHYTSGIESVQGSATRALENMLGEELAAQLPVGPAAKQPIGCA
ncbi:MAG: hypothetical protein ABJA86_10405 [Nocardioidaceae bacterium]